MQVRGDFLKSNGGIWGTVSAALSEGLRNVWAGYLYQN